LAFVAGIIVDVDDPVVVVVVVVCVKLLSSGSLIFGDVVRLLVYVVGY